MLWPIQIIITAKYTLCFTVILSTRSFVRFEFWNQPVWSYLTGSCYTAMAWMAGTSVQCQKIFFHWHENYELMINVIDQQPLILSTLKTLLDNGIFPKWSTQLSLNSANLPNHWSLSLTFVFVARHWSATQEITSSNNDKWFFVTGFNKFSKSI